MFFWLCAALFIGLITLIVLWAVTAKVGPEPLSDDALAAKADIALYKQQIEEVETDLKQGFIDKDSAKEARLEIARHILLKQKKLPISSNTIVRNKPMQLCLTLAIFAIPVLIMALYVMIGQPEAETYPFQKTLDKPQAQRSFEEQLVATEALFMRDPKNGQLADNLASQYLIAGQYQNAINSYLDSIRLNGENAPRLVGYGLALKGFDSGVISKDAEKAFEQAAKIAPYDYYPQLFIAEALEQAGESEKAMQGLQEFLKIAQNNNPQNARLRQRLENMIIQLQKNAKLLKNQN